MEGWASGGGLAQVAATAVARARLLGKPTSLPDSPSAKDVAAAAVGGDPLARQLIRLTGRRLGEVLTIVVDILNPERILAGGLAMRLGDDLLKPARRVLAREGLPESVRVCQIVPAELDEQSAISRRCASPNPRLSHRGPSAMSEPTYRESLEAGSRIIAPCPRWKANCWRPRRFARARSCSGGKLPDSLVKRRQNAAEANISPAN